MFTFSALINIILFSSISVILLSIVFKDNNAVLKLDIRFLFICLLTILLRLLLPIESPLAQDIPISHIYPDIYIFMKTPFFSIASLKVSVLDILKCIWLIGTIYYGIKVIYSYFSFRKMISNFKDLKEEQAAKILLKVKREYNKNLSFYIVSDKSINTPIIFGVRNPYIVLPDIVFSDDELYFIIKHEILHYLHGDLIIKIICELISAVYWWNPFVKILKKLISNMQEINVDFSIIKGLSKEKKFDYLECLVKVAKRREGKKNINLWGVAFQKESSSAIYKRICLVLENMEFTKRKTIMSIILSGIILGVVIFCPNIFIFEPYSIAEKDAETTFDIESDNVFYLKNHDSSFSLFWDGQYMGTVTEILGENIEIYTNLEEVEENE